MSSPGALCLIALGERAERVRNAAVARLLEGGLQIQATVEGDPVGPALVLFDDAAPVVLELLRRLVHGGVECLLAVASRRDALQGGSAWKLLEAGASDAFAYDDSPDWIGRVAARVERWQQVEELTRGAQVRGTLVGNSRCWRATVRGAVEAASFTNAPVVLMGETGTGKELVARLIHELDPRPRKGELVITDCTTIVPTLSGSEFFGHERGAFTGASAARDGAFALADGGTLFLDEVGELPATLQAELLRVVQEGLYKRVGGNDWRRTSFRLVCATNRDLFAEAEAGRFRHDLLYRLAGATLRLPSLRDRREDIDLLARHFLHELSQPRAPDLDDDVRSYLRARDYPGNVRELRQLIARIAYRHVGPGPITVGDVPGDERLADLEESWRCGDSFTESIHRAVACGATLREIGAAAADAAIGAALAAESGNLGRAARRLGVTPRALQMRRANGRLAPPGRPGDLAAGPA